MPEVAIELRAWDDVDERDRFRIAELARVVDWGTPPGVTPLQFGSHGDWRVLVRENGAVVSTVEILERQVLIDASALGIAGIGGVMTAAGYQGRGHASAAMRRAATFLNAERGVTFSLLVCWPRRIPFYSRLGWRAHTGQVLCDQPGGKVTISRMHVMVLDGTQCPLPKARIDLQGPPW